MKWADFILCCDECNKKLWDSLKEIEEDKIHYISKRKTRSWLPFNLLCNDCYKILQPKIIIPKT